MDKFRDFWFYAGERAYKTFAQSALAAIGTGAVGLVDVDWATVLSVSGLATILSVLTSVLSYDPYDKWDEVDGFDAWLEELEADEDSK